MVKQHDLKNNKTTKRNFNHRIIFISAITYSVTSPPSIHGQYVGEVGNVLFTNLIGIMCSLVEKETILTAIGKKGF